MSGPTALVSWVRRTVTFRVRCAGLGIVVLALVLTTVRLAWLVQCKDAAHRAIALGDGSRARGFALQGLRLAPNDAGLHQDLGDALVLQGDLPGATSAYMRAATCGAGRWSGLYRRIGDVWARRGNIEAARANWRKAVALDRDPLSVGAALESLKSSEPKRL